MLRMLGPVEFSFHPTMPRPTRSLHPAATLAAIAAALLSLVLCNVHAQNPPPDATATGFTAPSPAPLVVNITSADVATSIAVQACAGLMNRAGSATPAYVLMREVDAEWLADVEHIPNPTLTPVSAFLATCLGLNSPASSPPPAAGYILYNLTAQQAVVPLLLTVAGMLDAVPLEAGQVPSGAQLVYNAEQELGPLSLLEATQLIWRRHGNASTALAFNNPGFQTPRGTNPAKPALTGRPSLELMDFLVKARLFTFYLPNACIPLTPEHAFMEDMVRSSPWPRPVTVYGYDDTWPIAGDLFEAETDCVREHFLGQVASSFARNIAYFSRPPPIDTPMVQVPPPPATPYNASRTYVTFIVGDGDSVSKMTTDRKAWMEQRVQACGAGGCFPLVWSMSPHLRYLAPNLLRWYFNGSYETGSDYFVLPPSGHLYAYPGQLEPADKTRYVAETEHDAYLLNTTGSVDWEFFGTWEHAVRTYFPLYGQRGVVNGFFPVNVPFLFPIAPGVFKDDAPFIVFNETTVLFQPYEWRGASGQGNPFNRKYVLSVPEMAQELNTLPGGSVRAIYTTSDGGFNLTDLFDLAPMLQEHVQLVEHQQLVRMALQSGKGLRL